MALLLHLQCLLSLRFSTASTNPNPKSQPQPYQVFDRFIDDNELMLLALRATSDDQIQAMFEKAQLPADVSATPATDPVQPRLQPHVTQTATPCNPGCNPVHPTCIPAQPRLQARVPSLQPTPCLKPCTPCDVRAGDRRAPPLPRESGPACRGALLL